MVGNCEEDEVERHPAPKRERQGLLRRGVDGGKANGASAGGGKVVPSLLKVGPRTVETGAPVRRVGID